MARIPEIDYPAEEVNIRSASRSNYQVVVEGTAGSSRP